MPFPLARLTLAQRKRWQRLMEWSLDPPMGALGFAAKLARDNRWSLRYAERVEAEYRRFVFLAVESGHGVCPPEAVDRAWHQHLLETHNYWEQFCPEVLGAPLHHTPSRGGIEEQRRLRSWYARTLISYERLFGEAPPPDLWPPADRRFGRQPRSPVPRVLWPWAMGAIGLLGVGLGSGRGARAATTPSAGTMTWMDTWRETLWSLPPFQLNGPAFLVLYVTLAALALAVSVRLRRRLIRADPGPDPRQPPAALTPREIAYLAGGAARVAETALLALRQRGELERGAQLGDPIERDVAMAVLGQRFRPERWEVDETSPESRAQLRLLQRQLEEQGLLLKPEAQGKGKAVPLVVLGPVLALGFLRLQQASMANHPSGILNILFLLLALITWLLWCHEPRLSAWGDCTLQSLKASQEIRSAKGNSDLEAPQVLMAFALLGVGALSAGEAMAQGSFLAVASDGGSDGGGGCGGGGCGGCGGCGG